MEVHNLKHLRKATKCDMLLNIFDVVGKRMKVGNVCKLTGIKNYNSLKALFSYIRKAPHIPENHRIDVRIQDDICTRII